jgi:hypothetical protein
MSIQNLKRLQVWVRAKDFGLKGLQTSLAFVAARRKVELEPAT